MARFTEGRGLDAPLSRMAATLFDDRPAAVRGGLQVVCALMIGVLLGDSLLLVI